MLPGLHCFVFPSPSLLSLSSPSSKFSAAAGISHGAAAPASPHQVVRAASRSFLFSPWAVMRSACTVLDEPTRRSHGLRSSPNAHSIEPAHDPCSSSSSLYRPPAPGRQPTHRLFRSRLGAVSFAGEHF
ncbi:hypothetical protein PVAP13_6NG275403 [Panicum virgatum]|uniref:Uncharacterized protein n=1 Tax=Panicum virgatum TaxID=38727 RepID=A0A8T0R2A3_PANVG|nr:hypothetical protein PVAP13_6NG275403 [Panicum virgatum]